MYSSPTGSRSSLNGVRQVLLPACQHGLERHQGSVVTRKSAVQHALATCSAQGVARPSLHQSRTLSPFTACRVSLWGSKSEHDWLTMCCGEVWVLAAAAPGGKGAPSLRGPGTAAAAPPPTPPLAVHRPGSPPSASSAQINAVNAARISNVDESSSALCRHQQYCRLTAHLWLDAAGLAMPARKVEVIAQASPGSCAAADPGNGRSAAAPASPQRPLQP